MPPSIPKYMFRLFLWCNSWAKQISSRHSLECMFIFSFLFYRAGTVVAIVVTVFLLLVLLVIVPMTPYNLLLNQFNVRALKSMDQWKFLGFGKCTLFKYAQCTQSMCSKYGVFNIHKLKVWSMYNRNDTDSKKRGHLWWYTEIEWENET